MLTATSAYTASPAYNSFSHTVRRHGLRDEVYLPVIHIFLECFNTEYEKSFHQLFT